MNDSAAALLKEREFSPRQLEILLPTALGHGFDYLAPEGMALKPGDIVTVPFGRGEALGVVWGDGTANVPPGKMKRVAAHLSQFPALSDEFRQFIDWAAWYNCAPKGALLKMVLPISDIHKEGQQRTRAHVETHIDVAGLKLAELSGIQHTASDALLRRLHQGFSVSLLDGVTGSGKTEVYFNAIAEVLRGQGGKASMLSVDNPALSASHGGGQQTVAGDSQILVLLPEIALSVQFLERFEKRFGFRPVLWNSEITPARKRAAWQAIAKGEARIVVGARSALFLPYTNLSLIVIDEEHDGSYKQEEGVMYHARDMAVARARFEKIPLVLVSATPSLESYYNAKAGKYTEVSLLARHHDAVMPDIEMIDMRQTHMERGAFVSDPLRKALADTLAAGHQSMLFLNRRGYAPLMLCRTCGHRFQCPHCTSWMVVHKSKPRLECHHCGHYTPLPDTCPACNNTDCLHACGPGVERLLEEVKAFLPQARVAVMASDSSGGHREVQQTIADMSEGKIDLLIGTQMVAKGHHFAGIATVGVVDADLGLGGGDLRAGEHTYQLLHQLSGRAGREKIRGRVYLQSFLPEHPVMKALMSGDREHFLTEELQARQNAGMPPFARLGAVIIDGPKEESVIRTARQLAASAPSSPHIQVWGPAPAPMFLLRGKFRYRLLVKAERSINLPDYLKNWAQAQEHPSNVRIRIDIDPQSFM